MGVQPITIDSRRHTPQARERTYWTNIEGVQQPEVEMATICEIAEERKSSQLIKTNGIWFDVAISERERVGA